MRPVKCGSMTDLKVILDLAADNEQELAEPGADGVEDGIINHDFAGRTDGLYLFQPPVAAPDSRSKNGERGFV